MTDASGHRCYVGIDVGTSGCRGVAIDEQRRVLAHRSLPLPQSSREGARVQQDPEIWWMALAGVLRALRGDLAEAVAAIAIDGTSATLLLADAAGHPLTPAIMYNDARAHREARLIAEHAPARSGAHGASSSLAKLLWALGENGCPNAAHALHQADWLSGRLTGRYGRSDENNCLKLGYDPVARCWPDWIRDFDLAPGLLPEVVPPGSPLGRISREVATELGLPQQAQVIAGTTDGVASFLATGAREPGEAVTSLGSTLVLKLVSPGPVFAPEYGVYSHRLFDRWLVGGASNTGGAVLRHFFTPERMAELSSWLEPDRPSGLDYYPLCAPGERFPVADPDLPPRMEPRPPEDVRFFQGLLEGIAAVEAQGYQQLHSLGAPLPVTVRTVGGGAVNTAWSRIRARRLGVPLLTPEHTEAAYGAALLALHGFALTCAAH